MALLTPKPTEWIAEAPVLIEKSITIDAPIDHVWQQLADSEGWVDWFPGARECRFTSSTPHGVGSTRFVHMDQFKVNERITAWEPGRRWGMTVLDVNVPILAAMAEEALISDDRSGGTIVNFRIGVELTRLGRLLRRPLVSKQANALETGLENLRDRCGHQART